MLIHLKLTARSRNARSEEENDDGESPRQGRRAGGQGCRERRLNDAGEVEHGERELQYRVLKRRVGVKGVAVAPSAEQVQALQQSLVQKGHAGEQDGAGEEIADEEIPGVHVDSCEVGIIGRSGAIVRVVVDGSVVCF